MSTQFPKGCTIRRQRRADEGRGWGFMPCKRSDLEPADSIAITTADGMSTRYDCYRPPRPRDMSPVAYYKKFKCTPDDWWRGHQGHYYCNPAHCSQRWKDKAERDKHAKAAYEILG